MTSHVIDLAWSRQFHIIIDLKVDLIICHLTYLTFQINLLNQLFELTYAINLFIELAVPLAYDMLLPQIYVHKRMYFYLLSYV